MWMLLAFARSFVPPSSSTPHRWIPPIGRGQRRYEATGSCGTAEELRHLPRNVAKGRVKHRGLDTPRNNGGCWGYIFNSDVNVDIFGLTYMFVCLFVWFVLIRFMSILNCPFSRTLVVVVTSRIYSFWNGMKSDSFDFRWAYIYIYITLLHKSMRMGISSFNGSG